MQLRSPAPDVRSRHWRARLRTDPRRRTERGPAAPRHHQAYATPCRSPSSLRGQPRAPHRRGAVIANDLQMSGRFAPLERRGPRLRPPARGIRFETGGCCAPTSSSSAGSSPTAPHRRDLRALQRAHRAALLAQRLPSNGAGLRATAHASRPRLRATDRHPGRVLDPHRLRDSGWRPPKQRFRLWWRTRTASIRAPSPVHRADHVACMVADGRRSPTCRSRARSRQCMCSGSPRADGAGCRRAPASTALRPGRRTAGTRPHAVRTESRHLHAGPRDAVTDPHHHGRCDRHRGGVVAGRPQPVLHIRPGRQRPGLPRRARRRAQGRAGHVHERLQRPPRLSPDGRKWRSSRSIAAATGSGCSTSNRATCGDHRRAAGRVAELCAERGDGDLRHPRSWPRLAGDCLVGRPLPAALELRPGRVREPAWSPFRPADDQRRPLW